MIPVVVGQVLCSLALFAVPLTALPAASEDDELRRRGEYVFRIAGCAGCHTDEDGGGEFLAGGRALETPFGIFYSPNITPHPDYGIGTWSQGDFIDSLRLGVAPDGSDYFPCSRTPVIPR